MWGQGKSMDICCLECHDSLTTENNGDTHEEKSSQPAVSGKGEAKCPDASKKK